jgi:hypothetical protein
MHNWQVTSQSRLLCYFGLLLFCYGIYLWNENFLVLSLTDTSVMYDQELIWLLAPGMTCCNMNSSTFMSGLVISYVWICLTVSQVVDMLRLAVFDNDYCNGDKPCTGKPVKLAYSIVYVYVPCLKMPVQCNNNKAFKMFTIKDLIL